MKKCTSESERRSRTPFVAEGHGASVCHGYRLDTPISGEDNRLVQIVNSDIASTTCDNEGKRYCERYEAPAPLRHP